MGNGGTSDGALGIVAMMRRAAVLLAALPLLAGCKSIGPAAGAVAGLASGAGTANPVVGTAVAIGTQSAVDVLVAYIGRSRQHAEQDAIAEAAAKLPVGGTTTWEIKHTIPFGNEHGTLMVAGNIRNPIAECREIVFTVFDDKKRPNYVTTECLDGDHWHWALAEPATARWGFLQ